MKKIKSVILATVIAVSAIGVGASPVEAGSYCNPPQAYRSGDYVTYSSYGGGSNNSYHSVRVYKDGVWRQGPWVRGPGYSNLTLFHPDRNGTAICQVFTP